MLLHPGGDGGHTISFLAVMSLFAVGNMLLKVRRGRLPRSTIASWPTVIVAFVATIAGLVGNILMDFEYVKVFGIYFAAAAAAVGVMFLRIELLRLLLFIAASVLERVEAINERVRGIVRPLIARYQDRLVIYFSKGDNPAQLNRAALYVLANEQTNHLKVIHVYAPGQDVPAQLAEHLSGIDHLYPDLRIDFLAVEGEFGPPLIGALGGHLGVPNNYMFIGTPSREFPHRIEQLGGVRVIL